MRALLIAACLLATLATAIPSPAHAYPAGAYRTRSTGLDNDAACTKRAFKAMEAARLYTKASGTTAVYGYNETLMSYVVCTNGGRFAVIFCASTQKGKAGGDYTGAICDTIWKFMERQAGP